MKRVFINIMRRWDNAEGHQYVIGVYTDLAEAVIDGLTNEAYRAGKYTMFIQEAKVDSDDKIIEISRETAIEYAKLKYPEKFNDKNELVEHQEE